MPQKQAPHRFELVRAITVNLILLSLLMGLGHRTEAAPVLELTHATTADQGILVFTVEPVPTVITPSTSEPTPTREPIPIAAIAGQVKPMLTVELTSTTVITSTVNPRPKPTPILLPSDPAHLSPTRLVIPAIDLDAPIMTVNRIEFEINGQSVSTWVVPNTFAVGWHATSALPGQTGNIVINGHSNIYGEVFRRLEALEPDDEIIIYAGDTAHHYHVTEQHLLEEEGISLEARSKNAQWTMPIKDERLTLVTCGPYPRNTHRLIIVAFPIQPDTASIPIAQ
ncbi:MAG: sortase [Anaerolineae bacterium]